jgi:hypothetical protein
VMVSLIKKKKKKTDSFDDDSNIFGNIVYLQITSCVLVLLVSLQTSLSNGVPCIVFRGVSDLAGGEEKLSATSVTSLAAMNALTVAVEFIGLFGEEAVIHDH